MTESERMNENKKMNLKENRLKRKSEWHDKRERLKKEEIGEDWTK